MPSKSLSSSWVEQSYLQFFLSAFNHLLAVVLVIFPILVLAVGIAVLDLTAGGALMKWAGLSAVVADDLRDAGQKLADSFPPTERPPSVTKIVQRIEICLHENFFCGGGGGHVSQSADKLSNNYCHYWADFKSKQFFKIHPPICRITAHAAVPG